MHGRGARRIGLDQVFHRGQRVEQEVRLDLGLHHLHLRFRHLALQVGVLGVGAGGSGLGFGALFSAHQDLGAEQGQQ